MFEAQRQQRLVNEADLEFARRSLGWSGVACGDGAKLDTTAGHAAEEVAAAGAAGEAFAEGGLEGGHDGAHEAGGAALLMDELAGLVELARGGGDSAEQTGRTSPSSPGGSAGSVGSPRSAGGWRLFHGVLA